ncbi:MAG: zf-HC2 domain-containing protein, partial [Gemmataceae bacterium]|nr:zf-HC2 domain-containing protein [Gemmataceae bacterium]
MPAVHPSPDRLHDFLLGKLPDPEYAAVEAHLTACDECRAASAADTTADSLVELLAAAGRSGSATPLPAHTLSDVVPSSLAATREWTDPAADPFAPPGLADHPRYRLLRRLGMGGMGVAYLAEHRGLCRKMALKVIRPGLADRPGAAERFRRETRAVARLSHPNIVAAFDAEETGGAHFLVMEYVPGETLAELVAGGRPLPAAAACRAARDAAR